MELLFVGDACWDIYLTAEGVLWSIPKDGPLGAGHGASYLGDSSFIAKSIYQGHFDYQCTAAGLKYIDKIVKRLNHDYVTRKSLMQGQPMGVWHKFKDKVPFTYAEEFDNPHYWRRIFLVNGLGYQLVCKWTFPSIKSCESHKLVHYDKTNCEGVDGRWYSECCSSIFPGAFWVLDRNLNDEIRWCEISSMTADQVAEICYPMKRSAFLPGGEYRRLYFFSFIPQIFEG